LKKVCYFLYMARYVTSEDRLREKLASIGRRDALTEERNDLRKRRELLRRRIHAALYEPRLCLGDPDTGAACSRIAMPGTTLCSMHGGTTKAMQNAARMRLLYLVEPALRVLNKAMAGADQNLAVKAAQIILDRSGFHPHATLEIEEKPVDLSNLTTEQLKRRASRLINALEESAQDQMEALEPEISETVIDIEPESVH
jgi:hypothetical protein